MTPSSMPRPTPRLAPACLSLLVWFTAGCIATATDRFVATNGQNNTNPGRGLTVGSPYLTINFAADQAAPGDTIYIRGGTYRETVSPTVSGTSNAPIIFKPYNNEDVILSGLNLITPGSSGAGTWAVDSGSIYKIQLTSSYGSESNFPLDRITGCQVFVDGEAMSEARWPNAPTPMGIRRTEAATAISGAYTAVGSPGSLIYDASYKNAGLGAFATDVWKDGIIVFAPGSQWYRRVSPITGNTPNGANSEVTFTFNPYNESPNREDTDIGDPFFLMGRKVALDAEKEFFFDTIQGATPSDGRDGPRHMLYLRMPGSVTPVGRTVEMRRRLNAINLDGVSNLHFENLRIVGGRLKTSSTSSNCVFRGLDVEYASYTWEEEFGSDYDSIIIEGSGHQLLDSSLSHSTNRGVYFPTGGNHLVRNMVISDCFLSGIEMKNTTSNIRVENTTVFDLAGTGISAEARPNQVLYSHGYNSALFTTDCGTLNALNDFDGLGSEWAYNWMHDALGSVNAARDWYGSPAIRLDSGPSNFLIHHNIAWNTTQPEKTIAIWAIASGQTNYQDAKIRLYNNTVDQQIGFIETVSTPASLKGVEMTNNLAGVGMNISSSGTDATGRLYIADMALRNNLFNNISIPNNPTPPHSANRQGATGWTAPASPPFGYQLGPSSQAINNGTTVAGITEGYIGSAPDIGALEAGLKPFTPGAKVRSEDLAGLVVTPTLVSNSVKFVITGLPPGRSLPDTFRLKIAGNAASNDFTQSFNFTSPITSHSPTATFNALSTAGAGQSVQVSLDGSTFVTLPAAVTVPTSTLAATTTSLSSGINPATLGSSVVFTATVTSASGTPSGTVTFLNGTTALGTGTLSGGVATFTTSALALGLHSITASFPASASHAASSSPIVLQSVTNSDPTPPGIVRARFTDGNGSTTAQQFPGTPGDGWLAGWTTPLGNATVLPTPQLGNGGNFLSCTRSSGAGGSSQAGVFRQWDSAVRPYNQFARTTFDFRIDSDTTFDNAGDAFTIAVSNVTGTQPAGNSTVYLRCFGASPGIGFEGTAIAAREWCVFNGIPGTADAYAVNKFRRTGMIAVPGTTYSFTIDIYAAPAAGTASGKTHGTYDVTITDGTNTVSVPGSGFRSSAYTSGGYLSFATQQNSSTDNLAFSVDSIEMTALAILEPTTTVVTSNPNPANNGESVTITATVTSGTGTPTGSVNFFDGATNLGSGTLNGSGVATLITSALTSGSHSITASYPANLIYAGSTSPPLVQVIRSATSTTLASNANPANLGDSVTFTATVTGGNAGDTVNFFDGAAQIGSGTLASGIATFTTSELTAGPHSITASYAVTPTTAASTSPPLAQVIRSATSTTLVSNANPANLGASVIFTATVAGGNPGDTVHFFDGAVNIGSGTLASGIATLTTSTLAAGVHPITATYADTATTAASTSPELTQTILAPTPYESWLAGYFSPADLANPAREATLWGPKADPDHDTLANLLEYALELSPTTGNPLPPGLQATTIPLSLTFKRARSELNYTVRAGDDLTTLQDIGTNTFPVGTTGTVTDTAPADTPRRFLRLHVTQP